LGLWCNHVTGQSSVFTGTTNSQIIRVLSESSEDDGKHYKTLPQIPESFVEEYVNASGLDKALVKVNTHMDQHPDWRPSYNNPDNSGGEAIIYHLPEVDDINHNINHNRRGNKHRIYRYE